MLLLVLKGTVRNAIPREAFATLCFNGEFSLLESAVQNFAEILRNELSLSEPNLALFLQSIDKPTQVFDSKTNHKIIDLINLLPNGVIRNSDVVDGVVETSLSIGVLKIEENKLRGTILIRSLIESGREYVENLLLSLASLSDAKVSFSGAYPGWEPQCESEILKIAQNIYSNILGYSPKIKVIHAGLECGLLKKSIQI